MRFCCKTENFTKSAQFRSQNVLLVLTKKMSTHTLFLTINNEFVGVKLPKHGSFSPLLPASPVIKQPYMRIVVAHVDKRLCGFNSEAGIQAMV